MRGILDHPLRAAAAGAALVVGVILVWLALSRPDWLGSLSIVVRYLHVVAAMIWVGMIFFTNVLHVPAIERATDQERKVIASAYAPRLGSSILHLARMTLVTGAVLLVLSGYFMSSAIYGSDVYMPPLRAVPLWGGIAAAVIMWAMVEFGIAPNLRQILDPAVPPDRKPALREKVKIMARINLVLMLPVTFVMVLASHLV